MNVELNTSDYEIIKNILEKELSTVGVELNHTKHYAYKEFLKDREKQVNEILDKFKH